jgi:hypothetical protein
VDIEAGILQHEISEYASTSGPYLPRSSSQIDVLRSQPFQVSSTSRHAFRTAQQREIRMKPQQLEARDRNLTAPERGARELIDE